MRARMLPLLVLALLLAGSAGCTGDGTAKATLQGQVTIGPLCPVERPDRPCLPTPETYAARKVVVLRPDGGTVVAMIPLNGTGYYRTELDPGTYVVDINHAGIDRSPEVPRTVILRPGETLTLDISIDTGIR